MGLLSGTDEVKFRLWYQGLSQMMGVDPNPDNPQHFYDYRAAFKAGATPTLDPFDGRFHLPSTFKRQGHPRAGAAPLKAESYLLNPYPTK